MYYLVDTPVCYSVNTPVCYSVDTPMCLCTVLVGVQLEMLLYDTAKDKMMVLARAVPERRESATHETKFVQDAIMQLLKARHVLKCSYVYGYYLEEVGYKKPIFEFMQVKLSLLVVDHVATSNGLD